MWSISDGSVLNPITWGDNRQSWFPHSFASVVQPSMFCPRFSIASHDWLWGLMGCLPLLQHLVAYKKQSSLSWLLKLFSATATPAVLFPSKMLCSSPMCRATCIPRPAMDFLTRKEAQPYLQGQQPPWPHLLCGADHMCLSTFLHSLHTVTTWSPWLASQWTLILVQCPGLLYHHQQYGHRKSPGLLGQNFRTSQLCSFCSFTKKEFFDTFQLQRLHPNNNQIAL